MTVLGNTRNSSEDILRITLIHSTEFLYDINTPLVKIRAGEIVLSRLLSRESNSNDLTTIALFLGNRENRTRISGDFFAFESVNS